MKKLFGTDGIRDIANMGLDCDLAIKTAYSINEILLKNIKEPTVLIGKDTRISGDMLESAMVSAFASIGVNCYLTGIISTPGLAFLTKFHKASAGIMISASHNPFYYNGIKIFDSNGFKLSCKIESEIEKIIENINKEVYKIKLATHQKIGKIIQKSTFIEEYISHLKSSINIDLNGFNLAIDCANGSSSSTAEKLFSSIGANTKIFFNKPNGININNNCGSTNTTFLQNFIKSNKNFQAGIAFDGDADRCIMIDENGDVIDGDSIMAICADYFNITKKLKNKSVVGTIVSNIGLDDFYSKRGIKFQKSDVGDRNVIQKMIEIGSNLGGEISGHTIFLDYATTGDGQLTALQVLNIMKKTRKNLSELQKEIKKIPQKSENVKIDKSKFSKEKRKEIINDIVNKVLKENKNTYTLVRESGTENLVRITVQGKNSEINDSIMNKLKIEITKILG